MHLRTLVAIPAAALAILAMASPAAARTTHPHLTIHAAKKAAKAQARYVANLRGLHKPVTNVTCERQSAKRANCAVTTQDKAKACQFRVLVKQKGKRASAKSKRIRCHAKGASTAATPSRATQLHAHLDPTYTRDPLDPFKITYAFSASASQSVQGFAAEAAAPLPAGVLSLYSDGTLYCAINVGGEATGDECPVQYAKLGEHKVTTIYSSGEESATATEVENIEPLATTTSLSASYADANAPELVAQSRQCTFGWGPNHNEEDCEFVYEWALGSVTVLGSSSPAGALRLQCLSQDSWCTLGGQSINGELSVPVMLKAKAEDRAVSVPSTPSCEWVKEHATRGTAPIFEEWSYPSSLSLVGAPTAAGYQPSSAQTQLSWSPTLPC